MEYVAGGELFFHLKQRGTFSEDEIKFFAAEIVTFLGQLHSKGIIYRDLKPENILIAKNGHLKFTDFGLSKDGMEFEDRELTYSVCGTPEYIAPEIIKQHGHSSAVDWWSLGILLYELYTGKPPVHDTTHLKVLRRIVSGEIDLSGIHGASAQFQDLVQSLVQIGEKQRLGSNNDAQEVKEHIFFRDVDWEKVATLQIKPPFKPKIRNVKDLANFDKAFLDQAPVDSFVQSKVQQTQKGSYQFKDFEYNRVVAQKRELSDHQYDSALRSITLNESLQNASFGSLRQAGGSASGKGSNSFRERRQMLEPSLKYIKNDSPTTEETSKSSENTSAKTVSGFKLQENPFISKF